MICEQSEQLICECVLPWRSLCFFFFFEKRHLWKVYSSRMQILAVFSSNSCNKPLWIFKRWNFCVFSIWSRCYFPIQWVSLWAPKKLWKALSKVPIMSQQVSELFLGSQKALFCRFLLQKNRITRVAHLFWNLKNLVLKYNFKLTSGPWDCNQQNS